MLRNHRHSNIPLTKYHFPFFFSLNHEKQRHCRLKHDGDIRIELLEKGSSVYQPLQLHGNGQSSSATESDAGAKTSDNFASTSQNQLPGLLSVVRPLAIDCAGSDLSSTDASRSLLVIDNSNGGLLSQPNMLINLLTQSALQTKASTKRYQCASCPYETDIKSQFNYHNTLHGASSSSSSGGGGSEMTYQCKQCNFSVAKKHLLKEHIQQHHKTNANAVSDDVSIISSDSDSDQSNDQLPQAVDLTKWPSTSSSSGPIDLDELISASKVPNRTYATSTSAAVTITAAVAAVATTTASASTVAAIASTSTAHTPPAATTPTTLTNSTINKQILKLQELRNASGNNNNNNNNSNNLNMNNNSNSSCNTNGNNDQMKDCDGMDNVATDLSASNSNHNPNDPSDVQLILKDEKCPHCPFVTNKMDVLKDHLQCHTCVSGRVNLVNCDHCDYSIADETMLKEHVKIHFGLMITAKKNVAFYTSYDSLEINSTEYRHIHTNETTTTVQSIKTLFPTKYGLEKSSDKENKILVDVNTGQVLK